MASPILSFWTLVKKPNLPVLTPKIGIIVAYPINEQKQFTTLENAEISLECEIYNEN